MKFVLKFLLGIAVLLAVFFIFFHTQRSNDLSVGNLKNWASASADQRIATARVVTASDDANIDLIVACVSKMATLPDSHEMIVRDAISLCHTGIILKENI
ncbi:MAG: hypothetical protein J6Y49_01325 [Alphaproteobacteria bacterium]|nr:hypothetical protein [Alphaproteobacteria bacterium]